VCGVSECDREASILRGPWPTRGCRATGKKDVISEIIISQMGMQNDFGTAFYQPYFQIWECRIVFSLASISQDG
jgi:hypothetical protein